MKKYLAITAALALVLTACGHAAPDSTPTLTAANGNNASHGGPRRTAAGHRQRGIADADRRCGRRVLSGVQRL